MKKVYDKSFKIISGLLILVVFSAITFQGYLYFKNNEIKNYQSVKVKIEKDSNDIIKDIEKIGAKKFDLFKVSERYSELKSLSSRIAFISEKMNYKNNFSNEKHLESLSSELSEMNLGNENLWKNYTDSAIKFNNFVQEKNWKTLTRVGSRIIVRSPRQFTFDKDISYLLGINLKDLSLAQEITKSSSLTNIDKKDVLDNIDNLIILTNLIIEENTKAAQIRNSYLLVINNLESWSNFWSKNNQQILNSPNEDVGKISSQILILGFGVLIALLFIGLFILRKLFQSFYEKSNREIIMALDRIIVKDDLSFINDREEDFKNAVQTLNSYVKRRMSFGQIFQQTVPFPCILLDENLNFKWFNQSLIEQLNLADESLTSENLTWDSIKENISLSEHDPVVEAIESNVAGIFQVKTHENKSFQMYINPVRYNEKKYVVILLYPLLTVEDTIKLQVDTALNPVKKSLKAILAKNYNEEFSFKIKSEFIMNNNLDIWNSIETLAKEIEYKKSEFEHEMQNFEKVTIEALNNNEFTTEVLNICRNEVDQLQSGFHGLKDIIVTFSSKLSETIYSGEKVFNDISNHISNYSDNAQKDINFEKTIEKLVSWGIPSISNFKKEIKSFRDKLKLIGKIENAEAQIYFNQQEKTLRDIDLFFTKFDLFLIDIKKFSTKDSTNYLNEIMILKEKVLEENNLIKKRIEEKDTSEEELVSYMKSFYQNVVKIQKVYGQLNIQNTESSQSSEIVQH